MAISSCPLQGVIELCDEISIQCPEALGVEDDFLERCFLYHEVLEFRGDFMEAWGLYCNKKMIGREWWSIVFLPFTQLESLILFRGAWFVFTNLNKKESINLWYSVTNVKIWIMEVLSINHSSSPITPTKPESYTIIFIMILKGYLQVWRMI
jgi:hypothetical protein